MKKLRKIMELMGEIRLVLIIGFLCFGALIYFIVTRGAEKPTPTPTQPEPLSVVEDVQAHPEPVALATDDVEDVPASAPTEIVAQARRDLAELMVNTPAMTAEDEEYASLEYSLFSHCARLGIAMPTKSESSRNWFLGSAEEGSEP